MTAHKPTMILPLAARSDGMVERPFEFGSLDVRVPTPLAGHDVLVLGHWRNRHDGPCPTGRHLYDVLESVDEREVDTDDGGYQIEQRFRAVLTCVRCGLVEQWDGVRNEPRCSRVDPTPLRAGWLAAQQVHRDLGWGDNEYGTWHVHDTTDGDRVVGRITWARGPRGRQYYTGSLADPANDGRQTRAAEGATPVAVLRKLRHLHAARQEASA